LFPAPSPAWRPERRAWTGPVHQSGQPGPPAARPVRRSV